MKSSGIDSPTPKYKWGEKIVSAGGVTTFNTHAIVSENRITKIPKDFDYSKIKSMSYEAREKLKKIQPKTVSQASRISGVSPNDISVLLVYMGR